MYISKRNSCRLLGSLVIICLVMAYVAIAPQSASAKEVGPTGYHVTSTLLLGGEGGWDYLVFSPEKRQLFIDRRGPDGVTVFDVDAKKVVGLVEGTAGTNGTALIPELNLGFSTIGSKGIVLMFDMTTLKALKEIEVGEDPDCILYDPFSKMIFENNGASGTTSVIDPTTGTVVKTIDPGTKKPEFSQVDGKGHLFINAKDKNEVVVIDTKTYEVIARWSTGRAELPTTMAYDKEKEVLYVGGRSAKLAVMDAKTGAILSELPIGTGNDAIAIDYGTKLVFASNINGTITVIKEVAPKDYAVVDTIWTNMNGAKTMALDPKTHTLYLVAPKVTLKPGSAPFQVGEAGKFDVVPNTFTLITVSR